VSASSVKEEGVIVRYSRELDAIQARLSRQPIILGITCSQYTVSGLEVLGSEI
jgi:hypothetical protein